MNISRYIIGGGLTLALLAGLQACGNAERSNETDAEIEAAQIDGREAARVFLNRPWKDTVELQSSLLEARARQSKYVRDNKPQCAAAYDSAFVSTLRTVRPDVARELSAAEAAKAAAPAPQSPAQ